MAPRGGSKKRAWTRLALPHSHRLRRAPCVPGQPCCGRQRFHWSRGTRGSRWAQLPARSGCAARSRTVWRGVWAVQAARTTVGLQQLERNGDSLGGSGAAQNGTGTPCVREGTHHMAATLLKVRGRSRTLPRPVTRGSPTPAAHIAGANAGRAPQPRRAAASLSETAPRSRPTPQPAEPCHARAGRARQCPHEFPSTGWGAPCTGPAGSMTRAPGAPKPTPRASRAPSLRPPALPTPQCVDT